MNKNNTDWRQEIKGFTNFPATVGNNQQRSNDFGHPTPKSTRNNPQSDENKLEVIERLIKFLSADC